MKSEHITLELAGQEDEWLRNLLADVPLWGRQASPVSLYYDSHAAIGIAKNSVYNEKKRHIRIRYSAVKQLLKLGAISLKYVRSERNLADPMTKGLTRKIILETLRGMGLKPIYWDNVVDLLGFNIHHIFYPYGVRQCFIKLSLFCS